MTVDSMHAFLPEAARVLHVCRLYSAKYRGTRGLRVTSCVDCGRLVVVTPKAFRRRQVEVQAAGRILEIACDDCAEKQAAATGAITLMPTADDRAEALRIAQAEGRW